MATKDRGFSASGGYRTMMMTLARPQSTPRNSICLNTVVDGTGVAALTRVFRNPPLRALRPGERIVRRVMSNPVKPQRPEHPMPCLVPARPG